MKWSSRARILVLAILALVLSSCFSSGFLGFIATTDMMNTELEQLRAEQSQMEQEAQNALGDVESELQRVRDLEAEVRSALDTIAATQEATEELQALAASVGARLEELPTQTLRQLVDILSSYLAEIE